MIPVHIKNFLTFLFNFQLSPVDSILKINIALRHGCSPVNLLHIFRTPFLKRCGCTPGWMLLK